ncbi:MAG: hypothetical protein LBT17_02525 [Mycoplasmataceae bacterium]|nr:hypothetical protein [Mycoplasmataceae bacterium]
MAQKSPFDHGTKTVKPKWWRVLVRIIFGKTIPQMLFRAYLLLIIIGSLLLWAPISLESSGHMYVLDDTGWIVPAPYHFYDAMFIACSAITDTGLSPAVISETFNGFGQAVVLILIEIGGIGLMTIIFLLWHMLRPKKNIDLNQIIILQAERGNEKISGTYKSLKYSVIFIIVLEIIFGFVMAFWLCWMPIFKPDPQPVFYDSFALTIDSVTPIDAHHNFWVALWQGMFTSISAINNAGFDIFEGGVSMAALRNDWNVIFQLFVIIEFVIGGIGFPLIYDLIEKMKAKRKGIKYRLSLFTKLSLTGYLVVSLAGLAFAYGFEYGYTSVISDHQVFDIAHYKCGILSWQGTNEFGKNETFNKIWAIFFNTMSTRSAGFSTVNQTILSPGSQWTFIILMFVGASPSSTAGGIRTTTLMIVIWTIFSKIAGRSDIVMFKRKIPNAKVRASLLTTVVATMLVALFAIIVFYCAPDSNSQYTVLQSFYEVSSAFGTVGLSMGFTSSINVAGLFFLIIIMFIGQLGISSTLLAWTKKNPKGNRVQYPEEDVRIG